MTGKRIQTDVRAVRIYFPDSDHLSVELKDGRVITVPVSWFPRLQCATAEQKAHVEVGAEGFTLHWPDVDENMETGLLLSTGEIFVWPDVDMRIKNPLNPL